MRLLLLLAALSQSAMAASPAPVRPRVTVVHLSPTDSKIEQTVAKNVQKLKACGVEAEEITAATSAELESKLSLDLKPSTLVLLEGHGVRLYSEEDRTVHFRWVNMSGPEGLPKSLKKITYLPGRKVSEFQLALEANAPILHDPDKLLRLIEKKGSESIFVDTCFAGGCKNGAMCVGTSCSYDEESKEGNLITPALLDLLCSAAGDCAAFRAADTNHNGCINGDEFRKTLPDPGEKTSEIILREKSGDSAARARLQSDLERTYSEVELVGEKDLGVQAEVQILSNTIYAKYRERLSDPSMPLFPAEIVKDAQETEDWVSQRFAWVKSIEAEWFTTKEKAQELFAAALQNAKVKLPMTFDFVDSGKEKVRLVKSIELKTGDPTTEYRFKVTRKSARAHGEKDGGHEVRATPILKGFQVCWSPCKPPEEPPPPNSTLDGQKHNPPASPMKSEPPAGRPNSP